MLLYVSSEKVHLWKNSRFWMKPMHFHIPCNLVLKSREEKMTRLWKNKEIGVSLLRFLKYSWNIGRYLETLYSLKNDAWGIKRPFSIFCYFPHFPFSSQPSIPRVPRFIKYLMKKQDHIAALVGPWFFFLILHLYRNIFSSTVKNSNCLS